MAISRPSTRPQKDSCFAFWYGLYGSVVWCTTPSVASPLVDLLAQHGRAVVGHQRARQAALHERLRQPVHQALRRLVQVPLQVAHEARAIVDDAQQHRLDPGAGAGEHAARGVVEVQVPQRGDVLDLEAAHFQLLQPVARGHGALGGPPGPGLTVHALSAQVAPQRRVRRHRRAGVLRLACHAQVVQVQLRRPARMLAVLDGQCRDGHGVQAGEAAP
jgi:hypothetical protein